MCQNTDPGLVSSLPPLALQCGKNPNPCKSAVLSVLFSIHGVTVRKETGGGNPSTRGHGDQVTPQSLAALRVHYPSGALDLTLWSDAPPGSGDCGPMQV